LRNALAELFRRIDQPVFAGQQKRQFVEAIRERLDSIPERHVNIACDFRDFSGPGILKPIDAQPVANTGSMCRIEHEMPTIVANKCTIVYKLDTHVLSGVGKRKSGWKLAFY
jgi:hypothetical protein